MLKFFAWSKQTHQTVAEEDWMNECVQDVRERSQPENSLIFVLFVHFLRAADDSEVSCVRLTSHIHNMRVQACTRCICVSVCVWVWSSCEHFTQTGQKLWKRSARMTSDPVTVQCVWGCGVASLHIVLGYIWLLLRFILPLSHTQTKGLSHPVNMVGWLLWMRRYRGPSDGPLVSSHFISLSFCLSSSSQAFLPSLCPICSAWW